MSRCRTTVSNPKAIRLLRPILSMALLPLLLLSLGCGTAFGDVRADGETAALALTEWDGTWADKLGDLTALETLDLRGAQITVQDAQSIQAALGDAELLWNVPLGSGAYASDSVEIAVSDITAEDLENLNCFPNLKKADLRRSACWEQIAAHTKSASAYELLWTVDAFGTAADSTAELWSLNGVSLTEADMDLLRSALNSLPALKTLDLTEATLPLALTDAIVAEFPMIDVRYAVELGGKRFLSDAAEIDLSDVPLNGMDQTQLQKTLARFTAAETIDLHGTGLDETAMRALYAALPEAELLWTVTLYGNAFESNIERMDLRGMKIKDLTEFREKADLFRSLTYVDMCECGPSNEEMDALNREFENIRIVWMVYLRGEKTYRVRTDATTFSTALKANPKKKLDDRTAAPLRYCTDLIALDLGHNKVRDLSILSGMKNLQYLILVGCDASDITSLAELNELRYVELFANDIVDLTPLANKPHLLDLNISNNEITDLSPLFTNPQLERLWASRNPLAEGQQEAAAEALKNCTFDYGAWNATGNGWRKHDRFYEMRNVFGLPIID